MMSVSVDIDRAAVDRLDALLSRVAAETPGRLSRELRRAGVYICKALRARTKVAPKRIRASEYRAEPSVDRPHYITAKDGRILRRWIITKKLGTPAENTHHHYVYTNARRGKGGRMVGGNLAAERRELVRRYGLIVHRGLAKKSWGWVAQGIYNGGAAGMGDLSWRKAKHDRRDPRDSVRGIFRQHSAGASVELLNRLDYALDALPPAALNEGITAAVNRLEHNINHHLERVVK